MKKIYYPFIWDKTNMGLNAIHTCGFDMDSYCHENNKEILNGRIHLFRTPATITDIKTAIKNTNMNPGKLQFLENFLDILE